MGEQLEPRPCRHEYIKIYQRKLKGLERRMVATRAYLPIGFKPTDLGHLGEGSYAFCPNCRTRLYPRRTNAEKAAARVALAAGKLAAEQAAAEQAELLDAAEMDIPAEAEAIGDVNVEELVLEAVDVQDIEAEGVKLASDDVDNQCDLSSDEFL
jgi:hypothetical protein